MSKWPVLGAFIGAALGLLGSSIDILVWSSMGRPAVLVRQGWETSHIAITVFGGLLAGLFYGIILGGFVDLQRWRKNAAIVVPLTFVIAIGLYVAGALISIRVMNIAPWFCAHAVVFAMALLVARVGVGSPPGNFHDHTQRSRKKVESRPK
jgi:hypothetical protein